MVLMRVWPDSDKPLTSGKSDWKLKLEAWVLGISMIFGIAVAIRSLF